MNNIKIDLANLDDLESLVDLDYQLSVFHSKLEPEYFQGKEIKRNKEKIKRLLTQKSYGVLKAVYENKICGYLAFYIGKKNTVQNVEAYISDIEVLEDFRHQGIGKMLLEYALNHFKSKAVTTVVLEVYIKNAEATAFYDSFGFTPLSHIMYKKI